MILGVGYLPDELELLKEFVPHQFLQFFSKLLAKS